MFLFNEIETGGCGKIASNYTQRILLSEGNDWFWLLFAARGECNVEFSYVQESLSALGSLKLIEWSRRRQILYYPLPLSRQAKGISQLLEGLDWNFIRNAGGSLNIYSSTNIASINNTRVTKVPLFPAAVIPRILLSLRLSQKQWPEYICAELLHKVLVLATLPMNGGERRSEFSWSLTHSNWGESRALLLGKIASQKWEGEVK